MRFSAPIPAKEFCRERLLNLLTDYGRYCCGTPGINWVPGQLYLVDELPVVANYVDGKGELIVDPNVTEAIWSSEEDEIVTNLISDIQNDPEYLPYPPLRMKLMTTLSNVFMVKMEDQVMKELAANCGRVSRDPLIAKALSKRGRTERPDIPAEELREADQTRTQTDTAHT